MDWGSLLVATPPWLVDLALFAGRVAIGVCFVVHGLGKLGLVGTGSMQGFVAWLRELGVPYASVQARMAMLSELSGGSLLALGLFTRPACLLLVFTMVVAGRIGHRGAGYLITNDPPGAEYTINLAVICACFALAGPGRLSLDALIFS
jgi:putative oxidoreductase